MASITRTGGSAESRRRSTEQLLLTAARELIEEGTSFGAMSVGDISGRAGVSRPGFYECFPDKPSLLTGLLEGTVQALLEGVDDLLRGWPQPGADTTAHVAPFQSRLRAALPVVGAFIEAARYDPAIRQIYDPLVRGAADAIAPPLARLTADGATHPRLDAEFTAELLPFLACAASWSLPDGIDAARVTAAVIHTAERAIFGDA